MTQTTYHTAVEAAQLFPNRPAAAAVWRWMRKGIKARNGQRVRLQHVRSGSKLYTTEVWASQFLAAVSAADCERFVDLDPEQIVTVKPAPSKQRLEERHRRAMEALSKM